MRFPKTQIEGFHVNPEPEGDSWRCPYCDEPKWGETTFRFHFKRVCSLLCLNSLKMREEYDAQIRKATRDLEAASLWRSVAWALSGVVTALVIILVGVQKYGWMR